MSFLCYPVAGCHWMWQAQVIAERRLTRYRLQQMINTREQDLIQPAQPETVAALEMYAEGTATQLMLLQA